jgi:preprotein translocase subunit YajC
MNLNGLMILLAQAAPAPGTPGQPQGGPPPWTNVVPLLLMFVVLIMVFVGPQRKKQKQLAAMLNSLKPGDKIVTSSGIVGIVVSIKEKTASIRSAETKLEVLKSAISEITERGGSGGSES